MYGIRAPTIVNFCMTMYRDSRRILKKKKTVLSSSRTAGAMVEIIPAHPQFYSQSQHGPQNSTVTYALIWQQK